MRYTDRPFVANVEMYAPGSFLRRVPALLALLVALGAPPVGAGGPGARLAEALSAADTGRSGPALSMLEELLAEHPAFGLAHLIRGDLLGARAGAAPGLTSPAFADLLAEARARLRASSAAAQHAARGRLPDFLLRTSPALRQVIAVDVEAARLYLFERHGGELRLADDYYVSIGRNGAAKRREGDRRTPLGVYFVSGRVPAAVLPDFYGAGALPVNYPNEWDLRQRRDGYGIWLHGVPSGVYSRPPRASDGCLVLADGHLRDLWQRVEPVITPVVIAERLRWVERAALDTSGEALASAVETWRRDRESRARPAFARHYAADFSSDAHDREAWLAHEARAGGAGRFVEVDLDELSAFAYPGEPDLALVTFVQRYRSDSHASQERRRQYWRRGEDGTWRIVQEGRARLRPVHLRGIPAPGRAALQSASPS